jgi:UPF0755 protein
MRRAGARAAIISVLLFGILVFGAVFYTWNTATDIFQPVNPPGKGKTVSFEIPKGATTAQIADSLQAKGLIRNALAFRIWARIKGLDTRLQAGIYNKLNSSMAIDQIVDTLLNAQPDAIRVTILDGWRLEQIAQELSNSGLANFKKQDFLNYTQHINQFPDRAKYPLLQQVPQGKSMEGLLFPDSYDVAVNATARDVVNLLLTTMQQNITNKHVDTLAQKLHKTVYQVLIIASLVQREAGAPEDRGKIASVYWNRINNPAYETVGYLAADPTVQYARDSLKPPTKYWSTLETAGNQTAVDSAWNTYTHRGYPPTPICSSSLANILAAAEPPTTDFYYFVAMNDGHGHSAFAKNQKEQDANIQKYQK